MKLAIIGTRGIPNHYGGFEQISEYLSVGLAARGYEVSVYCSADHPYRNSEWNGINLIHCYDAEKHWPTAGQFIYDFNCIRDARKRGFDVLLFMGYTSSSIWGKWFPKQSLVISNMDGLEWKREKYSKPVQIFLKHAEKLAVQFSHFHIADSPAIKQHLDNKYGINSTYIPYGASQNVKENNDILNQLNLEKDGFDMIMARMEPENNIEMILEGHIQSPIAKKLVVVGNTNNRYGKKVKEKYNNTGSILFAGALFEQEKVNALRINCSLYFHGHSVGGTNPSLLEAMSGGALIAAHHNAFNKTILGDDAFYFDSAERVAGIITTTRKKDHQDKIHNNLGKIREFYTWEKIIDQYDRFIRKSFNEHRK
jgi:glycosyltransferase involved in cell wall biosynthesis